jgi:transcriptional regulator with PAS, ATPase and Fis domain
MTSDAIRRAVEILIDESGITSIQDFNSIAHDILIRKALSRNRFQKDAVKELEIGKSTLYRKIKEYGIGTGIDE